MGIWLFVLVATVIVGGFLYIEGERRGGLERLANDLGFSFVGGQQALPEHLDNAGFYLFTQGQPLIKNLLTGEQGGYQVSLFDFGYDAGKGEEGSRELPTVDVGQVDNRLQTVAWLHKPGQQLPDFDLSPTRHVLRRLSPRLGLRPLSLGAWGDLFRDRYVLAVRDEAAIRRIFSPPVIEAFAADPGWFIEGRGDQWLVYRLSERVSPGAIPSFLQRAIGLIDRLAGTD